MSGLLEQFSKYVPPETEYDTRPLYDPEEKKLNCFVSEKAHDLDDDVAWEIDTCILQHLPITEQLRALNMFVTNGERLFGMTDDISKLVYYLWPKYMLHSDGRRVHYRERPRIYPHNEFYEYLYTLETQLKNFYKSREEDVKFFQKGTRYVFWHICGLYPLLGENGLEMLVKVCQKRYDDAQDMMMFGIYQLDPKIHMPYIKKIFDFWNKNGNIELNNGGTGCRGELDMILEKWERTGYKPDKEFGKILLESGIRESDLI